MICMANIAPMGIFEEEENSVCFFGFESADLYIDDYSIPDEVA